ncbi:hypothetical protein FGADI_6230 [Fusarium gaditjirri]|uniref:Major facilitator superfamily (MFS) profile domain-containing protein n=1 Tax=Fusarium gaditjirri TaxID=282569 RepID=A0A8H4T826_9HYPO|nr:hypothetical protein FGADI_6230 [Fusarium gaditjirri]
MATLDKEANKDNHDVADLKRSELLEIDATRDLTVEEHNLGFRDAVRQYPWAVFWALFFGIAVIMAGFDAQIITSFYALPAFQTKYGEKVHGGDGYEISAPWQTALGMGNPIGQVLGALASSYPLEMLGRKKTLAICCVWSIAFVFVQFFSTSIGMLCAGEILGGLAYGFYVVIAPTYASEVCPLALRGFLTTSINMAFVIGQFIAQGCAAGVETRMDEWAYKIPFAIQWVWPTILLAGLPFAPESPYWLVRKGRREAARAALMGLSSPTNRPDIDKALVGIEQTDLLEQEIESSTSWLECFKSANLVRTEISVMVYLIQVIGGNPLIGYATYFFQKAGLDPSDAFNMGVGNTALGFTGTVLSWFLLNWFKLGRRTIYNAGMAVMTTLLFIIGFLSISNTTGAIWATATLMDIWTFVYQMTVGPICFVVISEISATRLREKTIAVATAVQAAASVVFTIVMPLMLNTDEANWGSKTAFLFGGISLVCLVWCYFRLPESQGRTFEELDILFQRRVPARQFKKFDLLNGVDHVMSPFAHFYLHPTIVCFVHPDHRKMVSSRLIVAAFAALASVANASPCKPSSTKAITTSANETAGSSTSVEINTVTTEIGTVTQSETGATATDDTTEALSTEASTTVTESATTTTAVDEPLLTNAGFDVGTTAPWQLVSQHQDTLGFGGAWKGPASGKITFGSEDGSHYSDLVIQKINKKALKAGSYVLEGRIHVDDYSLSGDGCSTVIAACLTGATGSCVPVAGPRGGFYFAGKR